jgi:hypothetical protein
MGLPELVGSLKEMTAFPGWAEPEPETGAMFFTAPLAIAGVVQEAFTLHGLCLKQIPDRNVTFELKVSRPGGRRISLADLLP